MSSFKTATKNIIAVNKAMASPEGMALLKAGLKLKSTGQQLENGTICLAGHVKKRPVSYMVTWNGAVLSNRFVVKQVIEATEAKMYRAGLAKAMSLLEKRKAV